MTNWLIWKTDYGKLAHGELGYGERSYSHKRVAYKHDFIYLLTLLRLANKSNITEEDQKIVSDGIHIHIGVNAARDTVKLSIKRIKR